MREINSEKDGREGERDGWMELGREGGDVGGSELRVCNMLSIRVTCDHETNYKNNPLATQHLSI